MGEKPQAGGGVDDAKVESVRAAASSEASKHTRTVRSAKGGRRLSALMLPFFLLRAPAGFGVITTIGRKSGKKRRKCIRVIRNGSNAYAVQLRLPGVAIANPAGVAGWVWNIRANPNVSLRIGSKTFAGVAREIIEPSEVEEARTAMTSAVHWFDYAECDFHLRGLPTRDKIEELHRYWFDTGIPLVVELADQSASASR
jgi:deazaflavin-dependent oxidoreductase (nitroreductase family)